MKTSILLPFTAVMCVGAAEWGRPKWTIGQTVYTSSGPVNGHPSLNQSQVSEYLGIPFAHPPIGDLRFAAPVKFTGIFPLDGTSFVSFVTQLADIS
jgi:hypothetical protein